MDITQWTTPGWKEHYRAPMKKFIEDMDGLFDFGHIWRINVLNMLDNYMSQNMISRDDIGAVCCACSYIGTKLFSRKMCSISDIKECVQSVDEYDIISNVKKIIHFYLKPMYNPFYGYRKICLLGQGNSKVFKIVFGEDCDKKYYAMKEFTNVDEEISCQFLQETRSLSILNDHPNCCTLRGAWCTANSCHAIFSLYPTSFTQFFHRHIDIDTIKYSLKGLLEIVSCAHSKNISHRDIKPVNIMFDSQDTLRLCDWDSSSYNLTQNSEIATNPICTLPYRAPELLINEDDMVYDACALDVWSVGCCFIYMVQHESLFNGNNAVHVLEKIISLRGNDVYYLKSFGKKRQKHDFSDELSEKLGPDGIDILDKMLTLNPSNRPTAAECLQHVFFTSIL